MKPTPEQIEQFQRDGYLPIGPVFTAEELAEVRAAYDRLFAAKEQEVSEENDEQQEVVRQITGLHRLDNTFRRFLYKDTILDWAEVLIGSPNIRLYHDQGLYKPPLHGAEVHWHRDNGFWRLDPATAVTCWIALDDADEENGCMRMIPGSHKVDARQVAQDTDPYKMDADKSLAVSVPLPAGSASFHHCLTLHNTRPNRTLRPRRAWIVHLMPADAKQRGKIMPHHLLLRGEADSSGG